jgi:hypothetical protein
MLDREIVTACCEIHTKQINALRRKNVEFLRINLVVHILTVGL